MPPFCTYGPWIGLSSGLDLYSLKFMSKTIPLLLAMLCSQPTCVPVSSVMMMVSQAAICEQKYLLRYFISQLRDSTLPWQNFKLDDVSSSSLWKEIFSKALPPSTKGHYFFVNSALWMIKICTIDTAWTILKDQISIFLGITWAVIINFILYKMYLYISYP